MAEPEMEFSTEQLPFSFEAEQSVLGAILIEPDCISKVLEMLVPESFYRPQHQQLFAIMLGMFTSAQPIDFITVLEKAKAEQIFLTDADAKVYLTQLVQIVPSASNVEAYAKLVQEKYYMRTLVGVAKNIISNAEKNDTDARGLMEFAEHKLYEIRQGKDATGLVKVDRAIFELYDKLQRISGDEKNQYVGIPTGYSALDSLTTGLNRSDLILLAARPAMGKSSLAMNIASNVAKQGHAVAVFSLEMSREQLISRMLSSDALIQVSQLRSGNLSVDDWTKVAVSAQTIAKMPMYIDDTAGVTVAEMKAKLRRVPNLGLVIIDYLQLMSSGRRIDNRVQEVSEITRGLKIMAKELDVPIITLSQLSRSPDKRTGDHRPVLSDLRESGSIEQDADLVMFLYRDEYYNDDTEDKGVAECIVAKNRHGATDTVKLAWDGQYTRFLSRELFRDAP